METTEKAGIEIDPAKVDIERMVGETSCSRNEVRNALGVPLAASCPATNMEEAAAMYYSDTIPDSEEERAALVSLNRFAFDEIAKATTVERIREIYEELPKELIGAREVALVKWVRLCASFEEANEVYQETEAGSQAEKAAICKLATFFLKD